MWSQYAKKAALRSGAMIPAMLLATGGSYQSTTTTTTSAEPPAAPSDTNVPTTSPPPSIPSNSSTPTAQQRDSTDATTAKVCRLNDLFAKADIFKQIRTQNRAGGEQQQQQQQGRSSSSSSDASSDKEESVDVVASIRESSTCTGTDLLSMLFTALQAPSRPQQLKSIRDIVATIRDRSRQDGGGVVEEDRTGEASIVNLLRMLDQYHEDVKRVADTYGKHLDISRFNALAFFYYLEHEDEVKNPSWKRRMHRFFPGIGSAQMDQLNSALQVAALSYADTVQEIVDGLAELDPNYQMVACTVDSAPGRPAHFLALHKPHQHDDNRNVLSGDGQHRRQRAILVIRGSKNIADTLTDILCEPVPYRGGQAHSFILESGRYIARKNRDLLLELTQSTGLSLSDLDLTIIGHSLGAGAATIAAMELKDSYPALPNVNVIGFGGPAILSQDLAEATASYVTSVINNDDVVPRMSGASVANVIANILEFNWMDYAELDITQALDEITKGLSLPPTAKLLLLDNVRTLVASVAPDFEDRHRSETLPIELYPAGKCIHLYRDGAGISGCVVPNTFFNYIDVSRTMISDHLIHKGYELTLLDIERQRTGNYHFKFDQAPL